MPRELSTQANAAKMIRAALKKHGIKGRVRSREASMMNAVNVETEDLPPWTAREIKSFVNGFQYGHFNGMTDSYEYSNCNEDLPQVTYAHYRNEMSEGLRAEIENWIKSKFSADSDVSAWEIFNNDRDLGRDFWLPKKDRI